MLLHKLGHHLFHIDDLEPVFLSDILGQSGLSCFGLADDEDYGSGFDVGRDGLVLLKGPGVPGCELSLLLVLEVVDPFPVDQRV